MELATAENQRSSSCTPELLPEDAASFWEGAAFFLYPISQQAEDRRGEPDG